MLRLHIWVTIDLDNHSNISRKYKNWVSSDNISLDLVTTFSENQKIIFVFQNKCYKTYLCYFSKMLGLKLRAVGPIYCWLFLTECFWYLSIFILPKSFHVILNKMFIISLKGGGRAGCKKLHLPLRPFKGIEAWPHTKIFKFVYIFNRMV